MKRAIVILVAAILFFQTFSPLALAAGSCCAKEECRCSQGLCCVKGKCSCPGQTCCIKGQCQCGQEAGCKNCKCS